MRNPSIRRATRPGVVVVALVTLLAGAAPAFADIYIYWQAFGTTWQVGSIGTTVAVVSTEDGKTGLSGESPSNFSGESHMAVVCDSGRCGIVDDCRSCHASPQPARSFSGRVLDQHRRLHFPRATVTVGASPVRFKDGYVRMDAGRMVLLDQDQSPTYRLPAGARLLRDTRTGQPLFIVYDGRTAPEPIRR